eukprot:2675542-Alexandrium_andersonii.AAC.1
MVGAPTGGSAAPRAKSVCTGDGLHTWPLGVMKRCGISGGGGVRGGARVGERPVMLAFMDCM